MHLEMYCASCGQSVVTSAHASLDRAVDRLAEEGPWAVLGDGQTVEDWLALALREEPSLCPHCEGSLLPSEESLGHATMSLLETW